MIASLRARAKHWGSRLIRIYFEIALRRVSRSTTSKHVGIATRLLDHRSASTTERYYNQARGVEASRLMQDHLLALRHDNRGAVDPKGRDLIIREAASPSFQGGVGWKRPGLDPRPAGQ
jgi:hypothetical protein